MSRPRPSVPMGDAFPTTAESRPKGDAVLDQLLADVTPKVAVLVRLLPYKTVLSPNANGRPSERLRLGALAVLFEPLGSDEIAALLGGLDRARTVGGVLLIASHDRGIRDDAKARVLAAANARHGVAGHA